MILICFVLDCGQQKKAIVYREQTSPSGDYGFLLETVQPGEQLSDAALYYKWRTYGMHGDAAQP